MRNKIFNLIIYSIQLLDISLTLGSAAVWPISVSSSHLKFYSITFYPSHSTKWNNIEVSCQCFEKALTDSQKGVVPILGVGKVLTNPYHKNITYGKPFHKAMDLH
jgi:hypothetical protein